MGNVDILAKRLQTDIKNSQPAVIEDGVVSWDSTVGNLGNQMHSPLLVAKGRDSQKKMTQVKDSQPVVLGDGVMNWDSTVGSVASPVFPAKESAALQKQADAKDAQPVTPEDGVVKWDSTVSIQTYGPVVGLGMMFVA